MDAFWVLMLISLAAVPLALPLRKVKLGGAAHGPLRLIAWICGQEGNMQ
jgi:hypothetical protein